MQARQVGSRMPLHSVTATTQLHQPISPSPIHPCTHHTHYALAGVPRPHTHYQALEHPLMSWLTSRPGTSHVSPAV